MKVSEFIKRFSDYPDFDLSVCMSYADDSDWGATFTKSDIVGLTDIGHSSKTIVLDIDFSETEEIIAQQVLEIKQLKDFALKVIRDYTECDKMFIHVDKVKQILGIKEEQK